MIAGHGPRAGVGLGRAFWTLWSATAVSSLGDGLRYVAFPLLAAGLSRDPRAVAVVFGAGYLPWPLFGLLSGAVVDRHDRRAVMWSCDALRAAAVAVFTIVLITGTASIVSLAVLSFLLGMVETLFDNAASAIVPEVVKTADLGRANSRLLGVQILNSTLIGAPLGAVLFGVARYLPTATDAISFAAAALLAWSLPGLYRPSCSASRATLMADIGVGIRWLLGHRLLRAACLLLIVINGTLAAGEAVLVLYARRATGCRFDHECGYHGRRHDGSRSQQRNLERPYGFLPAGCSPR